MSEISPEYVDEGHRHRWREYLTTKEVADRLRTSPETVRYWRHRGEGPPSFKVGRGVLYPVAELDAWIACARAASA